MSKTAFETTLQLLTPALLVGAAVLTARADYPSAVTNLNPVGYWRLNEPVATVGSRVTGMATNYGSVGATGSGKYYSITNVGVDPSSVTGDTAPFLLNPSGTLNPEYVEVPNTSALLTNTSMSIECWILRTNLSGVGSAISGGTDTGGSGAGYSGFILFLDNANNGTRNYYLRVRYSTNGTGTVLNNLNYNARLFGLSGGTTLGLWDHVVYTWNETTVQGYINGVALTPTSFPAGQWYHPNPTLPIRIGSDSRASVGNLVQKTWLAHVAIYTNVLTYEQVTNHFAATNTAATYKSTILADQPAGYWPLNESGPLSPPSLTPVTCTNLGSWGSAANGTLNAVGTFNTGSNGVPYAGFGGATCAYFSGAGSKVLVPPQSLWTSEFTFTAWARLPAHQGSGAFLRIPTDSECWFGPRNNSSSPGMFNNMLGVTLTGGVGSPTKGYMPSNEWAFVAWVLSPTESVVYVNGLASTIYLTGTQDFSVTNILLGDNFSGWLSDVALFDRALTPTELATLYEAAQVPVSATTLRVTAPDMNGDLILSGTTGRGRTARLWKSTDLILGLAGWTEAGAANGDSVTGAFSFTNNVGTDPQAFYNVE